MKLHFFSLLALLATGCAATDPGMPHLRQQGTAKQIIVDGKPLIMFGGELNNSSSSNLEYMKTTYPRLAKMNLNTVIASVSWELIKPREGQFDFSSVDPLITGARENNLKIVFLWFGSWKNGLSSYPPMWVKDNPVRFPPSMDKNGNAVDILSTLGDATAAADARAYAALMKHIREFDSTHHTVVAMQVENEVGMRFDSRDRSPAANAAFNAPVPPQLLAYMEKNKDALVPEIRNRWEAAGGRTSGSWEQIFGPGLATDEIFMAWHYARFVNHVAAAGKAEYPIPMYANCWLDQQGTPNPGDYPSGGPLAHVLSIWQAGAPDIDFIGPDVYVGDYANRCALYTRAGNPLFIPETNTGDRAGVNAIYAFGKHDAICFSPFGIDGFGGFGGRALAADPNAEVPPLNQAYEALANLAPLIAEHQGKGTMTAGLMGGGALDEKVMQQDIKLGGYSITLKPGRRGFGRRAPTTITSPDGTTRPAPPPPAAPSAWSGLIISTAPDEFVILTSGLNLTFTADNKPGHTWLGIMDEGKYVDGKWTLIRRINGDQNDHDRDLNRSIQPYRVYKLKFYQRP